MNNLDIINLPYPMFPLTEEEKVILRKCEILYATCTNPNVGLCGNVVHVSLQIVGGRWELKNKISFSLLGELFLEQYLNFDHAPGFDKLSIFLRRVWITKLLNQ